MSQGEGDGGKADRVAPQLEPKPVEMAQTESPGMGQGAGVMPGDLAFRFSGGQSGTPPLNRIRDGRRSNAADVVRRMNVMRKAGGAANAETGIPKGVGAPLDEDVRKRMQPKLGADLSGVRIHTSGESAQAASGFGARAFTVGSDVHFNAGQFSPGTKEGDRLLAHELTHVVQGQNGGIQRKEEPGKEGEGGHEVSEPHEPAEKEADKKGDEVADDLHGEKKDKDGKEKGKEGEKEGEGKEAGVKEAPTEAPVSAKLFRKVFLKRDKDKPTAPVDPKTREEIAIIKAWIEKEAAGVKTKWSLASAGVGTVLTKVGATAGTLVAPGIGTIIGGACGAVAGALVSIFGIGSKKHHIMAEKAKLLDKVDLLVNQPEVIDEIYSYIRALDPDLKTIASKIDAAVAELRKWEKKKADQDKRKQGKGKPPEKEDKLEKVGHTAHKGHNAAETAEAGAHAGAAGAEAAGHAIGGAAGHAIEAAVPVLEAAGHVASTAAVGVGLFVAGVDGKQFLDKRKKLKDLEAKMDKKP